MCGKYNILTNKTCFLLTTNLVILLSLKKIRKIVDISRKWVYNTSIVYEVYMWDNCVLHTLFKFL